ncbi:MAG TPA: MMPL family transporter [Gaiellales bacterium]|jgi:RND superfamily putative drug exporter|nr:MMPL family transporter [Gaiellales bacterium]
MPTSTNDPPPNFAARAGRWSAGHWKAAAALWLLFVAAAVSAGRIAGTHKLSDAEYATGEAARAEQILAGAGFKTPASEAVLVRSRTFHASDPAFRAGVGAVMAKLRTMPQVKNLRTGAPGEISRDRHAQLIQFDMTGKADTAYQRVEPVLDAIDALQRSHSGFTIAEFGQASATKEYNDTLGRDFASAERLTVPVTFLVLLLAFGAFVAAGMPVVLAFSAVLGSIGLSELASHLAHASDATNSIILLMGMAVGVDYSLFYLKREREERAVGRRGKESLLRAAATSGQAVLISGLTVLIAMAGMLFAGSKIFTSIGIGTMIVVFTSLVGSLTVLPALLGKIGDRVERGVRQVLAAGLLLALRPLRVRPRLLVWLRDTPTLLRTVKGERAESRVWGVVLRGSMRFPALAVVFSGGLLVVLALPVFSIHTKLPSFTDLPKTLAIVRTYDTIQASFPGSEDPAHVVVEGRDVTTPRFKKVYAEAKRRALATGVIHQPIRLVVNPAHTVARIDFPLAGKGQDAAAVRALETLRTKVIAPALAALPPGTQAAVTGQTAGTHDFNETMKQRVAYVFAFVLGLAFLLLLVTFRSIVIPIKAIVLNLLSVGAAYGILVWVFQDGRLQGLLDFQSNGAVVTWLPLFLFTVLFGLSMDYHVFILSRVKELVDRGVPTDEAVAQGIRTTASTVTAAAAVMVAVFAIFASLQAIMIKQMGVGLAVAVLLDATVIRGVLLPAAMKLLGDWNWYLPSWLEWLPRLNIDARVGENELAAAASRAPVSAGRSEAPVVAHDRVQTIAGPTG